MSEQQEIIQAIAALESRRVQLGSTVVDTALWALRKKLTTLPAQNAFTAVTHDYHLTVLVADLSDFTAMSAQMDAERVRDAIHAMWQQLDGVITAWGGHVDQHVGDGVIAHFGLPFPREDDPERAIQAALEMQMTLSWMNRSNDSTPGRNSLPSDTKLQMRIGIHTGQVFLGSVGSKRAFTAVGDTVNIAGQLEQAAPVGSILISEDVHRRVRGRFDCRPAAPVLLPALQAVVAALVVEKSGPQPFREPEQKLGEHIVRLVGRTQVLEQCQNALQFVADSRSAQLILITGSEGVGKSRLLDEFEQQMGFFPADVITLRGRINSAEPPMPYALLQDVFCAYFNIRTRFNPAVARQHLVDQLAPRLLAMGLEAHTAFQYACALGHLLGFDFSDELALSLQADPAVWVWEQAFAALRHLVQADVEGGSVVVLFLEDLHMASEETLHLLEALLAASHEIPLLVVVTAESDLLRKRPFWREWIADPFQPYEQIDLQPLSSIDSRHLINELLQPLQPLPLRLLDVISSVGGGDPFALEEMIRFLMANHVISAADGEWRLHMGRLEGLRLPLDAADLLQYRLAQLTNKAQCVLQRAAVLGRVFGDTAVLQLEAADKQQISKPELDATFLELERAEIVYRLANPTFNGVQDYRFRYERWRSAVYQQIDPLILRAYHFQTAAWLITSCSPDLLKHYAGLIGRHFEQAGDAEQAAAWYGRGADY